MNNAEKFERWASEEKGIRNFIMCDDGWYISERLCDMWEAWQAARASDAEGRKSSIEALRCQQCGNLEPFHATGCATEFGVFTHSAKPESGVPDGLAYFDKVISPVILAFALHSDELIVRRIWDEVRRAILSTPLQPPAKGE